MDEWIWTDAEVAAALNDGFIGVKLDGDIEKALTKQHKVSGYPTMVVLDAKGAEITRAVGYQSSKDMLRDAEEVGNEVSRRRGHKVRLAGSTSSPRLLGT
jgi:thioredoxin-related protein